MWLPNSDLPKPATTDSPVLAKAVASESVKDSAARPALPNAPVAKSEATAELSSLAVKPLSNSSLKPAMERPVPTPRQQKLWYTFMAVLSEEFESGLTARELNS